MNCPVSFAGPAPGFVGLDQINCMLPAKLVGATVGGGAGGQSHQQYGDATDCTLIGFMIFNMRRLQRSSKLATLGLLYAAVTTLMGQDWRDSIQLGMEAFRHAR
jgi:hypothetical protein